MFPAHSKPGLTDPALPAAAIYGANASGKTNVIRALKFMRDAVANSHAIWKPDALIPHEPFAGDEGEQRLASSRWTFCWKARGTNTD